MYAPSHASHASSAYHQVGVETGVAAASAHRLVGMLYDGFFDALAQARGALQAGRIEDKGRAIGRAVRIVEEGLRAALDDRQGGKLAANLKALYGYVALRLTQANLHNDVGALDECAQLIEPLRAAWQAIAPPAGTAPASANAAR
ncbi:MAG: flagellar export chaperone FliS [Ideonella sp.]|nr:flagellar export chaperone FliS [Ideonella sp.]